MARTHFSGPITAGSIRDTSGVTVGQDVSNRGYVVLTQIAKITQSASAVALPIVIPAGSLILSGTSYAVVDFSATNTYSIGTTAAANDLSDNIACAAGSTSIAANSDAQAQKWANVGDKDVQIYAKATAAGAGNGFLAITYAQAVNFVE